MSKTCLSVVVASIVTGRDGGPAVRAMVRNYGQSVKVGQVLSEVQVLAPKPATGTASASPATVAGRVPVDLRVASATWCGATLSTVDPGQLAIIVLEGAGTEHVVPNRTMS